MSYIGNSPALKYASFAVQHFTTSATTGYTLDNSVANENDIALFVNNVRQQPGSSYAYTASGTTLTLSAATTTSDTMYCVFIGKAVQTVNPGAGSVGTSQLAALGVTNAKIANSTVDLTAKVTGTLPIANGGTNSTSTTYASLTANVSGTLPVGNGGTGATTLAGAGLVNTPYFLAGTNSDDTINDATWTVVEFDSETYDSEGSYDTTTFRWTPQVAGYYWLHGSAAVYLAGTDLYEISARVRVNGSAKAQQFFRTEDTFSYAALNCSVIYLLNGSSDYVDFQILADTVGGVTATQMAGIQNTFTGFRLIS